MATSTETLAIRALDGDGNVIDEMNLEVEATTTFDISVADSTTS